MKQEIYANALLSDGKILFWWTGKREKGIYDFYKYFIYSEIDQKEYFDNHKMECKSMKFEYECEEDMDSYDMKLNNLCFEKLSKTFYKLFEISDDAKGENPY